MTSLTPARPARPTQLLRDAAFNDLRDVVVVETQEEVAIVGVVRSYYLKQMAQEVVRPALAGRRLRNRLVVIPD